jgi:hypothetical protein
MKVPELQRRYRLDYVNAQKLRDDLILAAEARGRQQEPT